jgi:cell division protein FtsQ
MAKKPKKTYYQKQSEDYIFRRKLRFLLIKIFKVVQAVFLICFIGALVWIFLFGGNKIVFPYINLKANKAFIKLGLGIYDVEIEGNNIVKTNIIVDKVLSHIGNPHENSIILVKLSELENEIKEIGWVDEASIRKKFPGSIIIKIKEREPSCMWQQDNKIYLSDIEGNLITDKVTNEYLNLPLIVGKDSKNEVPQFFGIISSSPYLYSMVKEGKRVGKRRWDIILQSGVIIKLPEKNYENAWKKLADLDKENKILSKDVNYIDLRIENQVVTGLNDVGKLTKPIQQNGEKP